jgi:hypothetical protein
LLAGVRFNVAPPLEVPAIVPSLVLGFVLPMGLSTLAPGDFLKNSGSLSPSSPALLPFVEKTVWVSPEPESREAPAPKLEVLDSDLAESAKKSEP